MKPTALFLFIALLLTGIPVQAQTFIQKCSTGQELKYQIQADQKTVALVEIVMKDHADDEDFSGDLVIPEKVTYKGQGYSVTVIGKRTFVGCYDLQTVTIPNTITSIDESAFGDGGETGIYDVKVADDHPFYQVEAEENEDATMNSIIWTTKLIDKRTQKVLWFTVEELLMGDPEEISEKDDDCEGMESPILRMPEVRTEFPGGMDQLKKFLADNFEYPQGSYEITGVVLLEFVVEKDGSIFCVKVLRSLHPNLDAEAIRVVKAMPKWIPAQNGGEPCRSYYTLPFSIVLK